jgi:hypothetical protein
MGERRAARRNTDVEWRTVDADVGDRCSRADGCGGHDDRGAGNVGKIDVHLWHVRTAHGDGSRVAAGVARFGPQLGVILVPFRRVVPPFGGCCLVVLMRRWAVVVLRMIVPEVLVHMQRRRHGRRDDQGLNKRACDEATHRDQSNRSHVRRSLSSSMTPSASTIRDTPGSRRQMACIPAARAPATSTSGWSPTKTA